MITSGGSNQRVAYGTTDGVVHIRRLADGAAVGGADVSDETDAFGPVDASLAGTTFAQLAFGTLGVLFMASEYSTGMIRSSLAAVPKRLPVLWGKIAVFASAYGSDGSYAWEKYSLKR